MENIAVRSDGQLLVTLFTSPELYQIDPFQQNPTPQLVAQFPEALGILGIAEIEEDVFIISSGNVSFATQTLTPQSFSVWKADLRNQSAVALSKITDIPEAVFLNGVTTVERGSEYVLIADSLGGVIWHVNVKTSAYDVALNDTLTRPTSPSIFTGGFGANGVHTKDGFLYFTNTNLGFFRVPILDDGKPSGQIETLTNFTPSDDFTFDKKGNIFVARGAVDIIDKVTPAGQVAALAYENADALELIEGNTAVQFGRTECDKKTLYVTTNGGLSGNATSIQGGLVLAIDLGENY